VSDRHTLSLPTLPGPTGSGAALAWEVALAFNGGGIVVRLVQTYQTMPDQTLVRFEAPHAEAAEEQARRAWSNYRAVHGA
jgi:hypothetical protein